MWSKFTQTKFYKLAAEHWYTTAFLFGFITDFLLLNQIDNLFDNLILLWYVTLSTGSLIVLYAAWVEKFPLSLSRFLVKLAPVGVQYATGGLLSGMLIFYGRSGNLLVSWPFIAVIIIAIIGNERVKNRVEQLTFTLATYFFGLFAYLVLVLPVLTGRGDELVFYGAGILALGTVSALIIILRHLIDDRFKINWYLLWLVIGGLYAVINLFYILRLLPPIPMSLQEVVIANSVTYQKSAGQYQITATPVSWWDLGQQWNQDFHPTKNGSVSCYTKVFAPGRLKTSVVHVWEYRNTAGKWQEYFRLAYPIVGNTTTGYRGYSTITNYHDGVWRCRIENEHGAVLGQQTFTIDTSTLPVSAITYTD